MSSKDINRRGKNPYFSNFYQSFNNTFLLNNFYVYATLMYNFLNSFSHSGQKEA